MPVLQKIFSPVQPKADQPLAEALLAGRARGLRGKPTAGYRSSQRNYIYVLRSLKNKKRYVGYTTKAPLAKLEEHNDGATRWTRQNRPFVLLYHESYDTSKKARQRELFLKSGKGRRWLDEVLDS